MAGDFCDKKMPGITASLQIHMSTESMELSGENDIWLKLSSILKMWITLVIFDHQRLSLQDLLLLVPSQELICNLQTMLAFSRCTGVNVPHETERQLCLKVCKSMTIPIEKSFTLTHAWYLHILSVVNGIESHHHTLFMSSSNTTLLQWYYKILWAFNWRLRYTSLLLVGIGYPAGNFEFWFISPTCRKRWHDHDDPFSFCIRSWHRQNPSPNRGSPAAAEARNRAWFSAISDGFSRWLVAAFQNTTFFKQFGHLLTPSSTSGLPRTVLIKFITLFPVQKKKHFAFQKSAKGQVLETFLKYNLIFFLNKVQIHFSKFLASSQWWGCPAQLALPADTSVFWWVLWIFVHKSFEPDTSLDSWMSWNILK